MKNLYSILLTVGLAVITYSCNSYDDPNLNPNETLGNPEFLVVADTTTIADTGGVVTFDVTTNTMWWTVTKSSADYVTLSADTVEGSGVVKATITPNLSVSERTVTISFKSGTIGPKKDIKITQKGLPAELSVTPATTTFASGENQLTNIAVTCDGQWAVKAVDANGNEISWIKLPIKTEGASDAFKIPVVLDRNTGEERTAKLIFSASNIEKEVIITQAGGAVATDAPNNTNVIYFETFVPASGAAVGSTWTLTDSRDGTKYDVRLLADGNYWMVSDLKFAGYSGNISTFEFNGEAGKDNSTYSVGDNIPYLWGSVGKALENKVSDASVGYYYDWLAAVQDKQGKYQGISFYPSLPFQGIAPEGWHLPSATEYEGLIAKYSFDQLLDKSLFGAILGGDLNQNGKSHWGGNAKAYYWTVTQSSAAADKAGIFYMQTYAAATAKDPERPELANIDYSTPKKYGCLIRLVKN